MATPLHLNPCPGGHKIYNFGRPFRGNHHYTLSLSEPCPWVEKKIFQEIQQFYTFYPKITSPLGGGSWNLQFLVSLPYRCYIPNLFKLGPVVLEQKMLTHDARRTTHVARRTTNDERRRTPTHGNRSPEWLRWPNKI